MSGVISFVFDFFTVLMTLKDLVPYLIQYDLCVGRERTCSIVDKEKFGIGVMLGIKLDL